MIDGITGEDLDPLTLEDFRDRDTEFHGAFLSENGSANPDHYWILQDATSEKEFRAGRKPQPCAYEPVLLIQEIAFYPVPKLHPSALLMSIAPPV